MLEPDLFVLGVDVGPEGEGLGGILFVVLGIGDPDVWRPLARVDRRCDATAPRVLNANPEGVFETGISPENAYRALLGEFGPLALIRRCILRLLSRGAGAFEAAVDPDGVAATLLRADLYVALDHRTSWRGHPNHAD